jgi:hypothetical protein
VSQAPQEPGDDGLTDAEREQYAAQWRNGPGSRTLALPPDNQDMCPYCGEPDCIAHRAGG